jgi:hypothetical protein
MAVRIEINPVGNFDVHGDKLGQTWQRWHRSFELYATGKGVTDEKQKKALFFSITWSLGCASGLAKSHSTACCLSLVTY